jgi:hypothetical protein
LLIADYAGIRAPKYIRASSVAQAKEQCPAQQRFVSCASSGISPDTVGRNAMALGGSAEDSALGGFRVHEFDQMLHLHSVNVDEMMAHELIGRISFRWFKLLEPVGKALEEPGTCQKALIPIVLQACHEPKPTKLCSRSLLIPQHDRAKHAEG